MNLTRIIRLAVLQTFFFMSFLAPAFAAMDLPEKLVPAGVYQGAKIIQVMESGTTSMAMVEVKATRDDVLEFYKQKLKQQGWKIAMQVEQEDSAVIHFTKDKMAIQVNVNQSEDGLLQYQLIGLEQ